MVNKEAVHQAVRAALALGAEVQPTSVFERKHYYYYDLPAGYQITQQSMPLATGGALEVHTATDTGGEVGDDGVRTLRLTRLQLEQDSGKTTHEDDDGDAAAASMDGGGGALSGDGGRCLVDLNRAGVALVEFVFEPDLRRSFRHLKHASLSASISQKKPA